MARNGSDDATRKGTMGVAAVEGLLAYAGRRSRWGGGALSRVHEAIGLSRELVAADPDEHSVLLARCLRAAAKLLLRRGQAQEALPLAQEAVELCRPSGGAPLIVSLACLSDVYEALQRYGDAAEAMTEATAVDPPD
ncbi:tetratricopeptide repeat protein [Nonomuraea sp. NPDC049141]|uniref:tetratricopeptide repeat protein n=1 Tax=unclassified Nonomuraea TaxID=2593643 RepID=UPI0034005EC2